MTILPNKHTRGLLPAIMASSILLASCGGSDLINPGGGGTGNSATTSAVGPITGFGSIIVNGIRYDDSSAVITTEGGDTLSSSDLRLGMMVALRGTSDSSAGTGSANTITAFSELKGVVSAATVDSLTVSGVTVALVPSTIFDGGVTVVTGDFVEVYGSYDPTSNTVIATRVERKSPDDFKLRGQVSAWDQATQRFVLNGTTIAYDGVTLPAGFADGTSVRVYGSNQPPIAGVWFVSRIRIAYSDISLDDERAEIEGIITAFTDASNFTVNGLLVDASGARFEDGTAAELATGRRVEVEGDIDNGRLVAQAVEFEDGSSSGSSGSDDQFEIKGFVENFVSAASFSIRNTRIDASRNPVFEDGTAADLRNGVCVEIDGNPESDSMGTVIAATEVKFDDDCN